MKTFESIIALVDVFESMANLPNIQEENIHLKSGPMTSCNRLTLANNAYTFLADALKFNLGDLRKGRTPVTYEISEFYNVTTVQQYAPKLLVGVLPAKLIELGQLDQQTIYELNKGTITRDTIAHQLLYVQPDSIVINIVGLDLELDDIINERHILGLKARGDVVVFEFRPGRYWVQANGFTCRKAWAPGADEFWLPIPQQ